MTGVVGRLFKEFSVTLSVAVVVSAVVSLTLTPMMCGRICALHADHHPGRLARISEAGFNALLAAYRRSLAWTLLAPDIGAAGRRRDAGRHHRALYRGAKRLPATAGHWRTRRGDGGSAERFHPPAGRVADAGRADCRARSRGDRRGFVRRRRDDQRHAEHRPPDHRAEADQPARHGARGDRAAAARNRRYPRHNRVLPAGAGHPDRHAHQPHAVPVHADGHRSGRACAMGAAPAAQTCRRSPRCGMSPPISRTTASVPTSMSIATRRCGSAYRCRRSRTRCTMRLASGRYRPSSASPTSTA